jgi:hypothetical protein
VCGSGGVTNQRPAGCEPQAGSQGLSSHSTEGKASGQARPSSTRPRGRGIRNHPIHTSAVNLVALRRLVFIVVRYEHHPGRIPEGREDKRGTAAPHASWLFPPAAKSPSRSRSTVINRSPFRCAPNSPAARVRASRPACSRIRSTPNCSRPGRRGRARVRPPRSEPPPAARQHGWRPNPPRPIRAVTPGHRRRNRPCC